MKHQLEAIAIKLVAALHAPSLDACHANVRAAHAELVEQRNNAAILDGVIAQRDEAKRERDEARSRVRSLADENHQLKLDVAECLDTFESVADQIEIRAIATDMAASQLRAKRAAILGEPIDHSFIIPRGAVLRQAMARVR